MTNHPTEQIARETLTGLLDQVEDLTHPANDGNDLPWQMAEDKLLEALVVVRCVQTTIHARRLTPAEKAELNKRSAALAEATAFSRAALSNSGLHPLFADLCRPVSA